VRGVGIVLSIIFYGGRIVPQKAGKRHPEPSWATSIAFCASDERVVHMIGRAVQANERVVQANERAVRVLDALCEL
jgi:hypothetical protein